METIKTIAEWVEYVGWVTGNRSNGSNGKFRYYYRGEPEDYGATGATPGIGRGGRLSKEAWLFREAERRLPDEFARCKSTFEKLVLMQHYQLPTRLLDISMNALSALFFACYIDPDYGMSEEKEGRRDGAIYIYKVPEDKIKNYHSDVVSILSNIAVYDHPDNLDIRKVPADEGNDRQIFNSNKAVQYLLHEIRAEKPYFKDWIKKKDMEGIFCVHPLMDNPRLRAQQGVFLLYGMDGDRTRLAKWDTGAEDIVREKVLIPASAKKKLLQDLNMLGMTVDVIYPDWKGTRLQLNK